MSTIERRWQSATVVAAILLGAAIIAATQYLRPAVPTAAVSPDAPPPGIELLYFVDHGHRHSLVAYDWAGHRRGSITLPSWVDLTRLRMAPDGSSFVIDPAFDGDWLGYFDRLGRTVVETQPHAAVSGVWADDNRHLCLLDGPRLVVRLPGSQDRIANVQAVYDQPGSVGLSACSLRSDTAFLFAAGASETVMRVRLATGKVLNSATFPSTSSVIVSSDASRVAVGLGAGGPTMVYRASDLTAPVAELDRSFVPMAFSGDGASLLTTYQSGDFTGLQLFDWRSGKLGWRLDQSPNMTGQVLPRPYGGEMAFALADSNGNADGIFIVRHDGTTLQLAAGEPVSW